MKRGRVFVVSGPSGAGKNTIIDALIERHPTELVKTISATTRKPRPDEVEGKNYFFLSQDEFLKRVAQGKFLEHFRVHDNEYGTLREQIEKPLTKGKKVIAEIDVKGAMSIKDQMPEAILTFINAPSVKELERRIRKRHGGESEEAIQIRITNAKEEIEIGKTEFDHYVINDVLEKAISNVGKIILTN